MYYIIMNLFLKYFLFIILFILTILSISFTDFLILWIFMEITNFIYIIHLIFLLKYKKPIFLYFLIQFISSSILIMTLIINTFFINNFHYCMIMIALLMKIGIPPFHFWMIIMAMYMNWITLFIMLSIQKFIPMYMFSLLTPNFFLMNFMILMCIIIPLFMSLNLLNYKKLLTYSSINQMGWMILLIYFKPLIWFMYFCMYSFLLFLIMFYIHSLKLFYHFSINYSTINLNITMFMMMLMINFSGLPPFSFFLLKWYNIFLFTLNSNLIILFILMLISSLIMTYIYINMMMKSLFNYLHTSKYLNLYPLNLNLLIFTIIFFSFSFIILIIL